MFRDVRIPARLPTFFFFFFFFVFLSLLFVSLPAKREKQEDEKSIRPLDVGRLLPLAASPPFCLHARCTARTANNKRYNKFLRKLSPTVDRKVCLSDALAIPK